MFCIALALVLALKMKCAESFVVLPSRGTLLDDAADLEKHLLQPQY